MNSSLNSHFSEYSPVPAGHVSITIADYAHFSETRASEGRRKGETARILGMTWQLQAFFAFRAGAQNFQLSLVAEEEGMDPHASYSVAICLHIIGKAMKEKKFIAQFNQDMKAWSCFMAHVSGMGVPGLGLVPELVGWAWSVFRQSVPEGGTVPSGLSVLLVEWSTLSCGPMRVK